MKAVIDEGVPRRLAPLLQSLGKDVADFPTGWKGLTNGELLMRVEQAGFSCLLTCDRNLRSQQTISDRGIGLVVLPAQRFRELEAYAAEIASALDATGPGIVIEIPRR